MPSAGVFHQPRNARVMDMRNLGEQVMLDLEVQAAQIPSENAIIAIKVDGGLNLMHSPVVGNLAGGLIGQGELGFFNHVRQLKHDADENAVDPEGNSVEQEDDPQRVK